MIPPKRVILDANILLRAIFGQRTNQLLTTYVATIEFYTPITCINEALRNYQ